MHRHRVEEKIYRQERIPLDQPDSKVVIIRYFFVADHVIAKSSFDPKIEEVPEDQRLASMNFVFAVDYRCNVPDTPSGDMLGAFSRNVVFHAWPYLREAMHAECARMRLPAITLPMLKTTGPVVAKVTGAAQK